MKNCSEAVAALRRIATAVVAVTCLCAPMSACALASPSVMFARLMAAKRPDAAPTVNASQTSQAPAKAAAPAWPRHPGRNGPLTAAERKMAEIAWSYFAAHTDETTGLANAVGDFPSTTMWDTASYISGLVSAYELGIIDKEEFDSRTIRLLTTLKNLALFRGELPNKVYHTKTGAKVAYDNKPGEIGYSAMDIGRMLIWLKIVEQRYPYLANAADNVVLQWNFCHVVADHGYLNSAGVEAKTGQTQRFREGRLGYLQYAAKGFGLWGFQTTRASRAYPFDIVELNGIHVAYDARDPRTTGSSSYVLSEAFLLDGIEMNFDRPDDTTSSVMVHTDGWRAEFSAHVYMAQQRRFEKEGILTARTEHQVDGPPYFVYDSVYSDGFAWNTQDPKGGYEPTRAAVSTKGAMSLWAMYDTPYTDLLFSAVSELGVPDQGLDEGVYENGAGPIPLQTANNNGIVLATLLYKVQGPILIRKNPGALLWNTAFARDDDVREAKCLPDERPVLDCSECKVPPGVPLWLFEYCKPIGAGGRKRDDDGDDLAVRDCQVRPYAAKTVATTRGKPLHPRKTSRSDQPGSNPDPDAAPQKSGPAPRAGDGDEPR